MTGKEKILSLMSGKSVGQVPWVPFTGVHGAKLIGKKAEEFLKSKELILEGLNQVVQLYQPDGMPIYFDLQVEAEALGAKLKWSDDNVPLAITHPLMEGLTLDDILIPTKESGRLPVILDVMESAKTKWGKSIALYGLVTGPLTIAYHLRGSMFFTDMIDDIDFVVELLSFATKVSRKISTYYIEAGMDVIAIVDPLVSAVSPEFFKTHCQLHFTNLFDNISVKERKSSFFVCGNATNLLEAMALTNPDSISVDENVNMKEAKEILSNRDIVLCGNIPLTTLMLYGNQQDNMKYVVDLIDEFDEFERLIVSPGCDMPFGIPKENVIAVSTAVRANEKLKQVIRNYEKTNTGIDIQFPDYTNLDDILIEVFTLDSNSCVVCTSMLDVALKASTLLEDVKVIERKYVDRGVIARCKKQGVNKLPSIMVNGILVWESIVPSVEEIRNYVKKLN